MYVWSVRYLKHFTYIVLHSSPCQAQSAPPTANGMLYLVPSRHCFKISPNSMATWG